MLKTAESNKPEAELKKLMATYKAVAKRQIKDRFMAAIVHRKHPHRDTTGSGLRHAFLRDKDLIEDALEQLGGKISEQELRNMLQIEYSHDNELVHRNVKLKLLLDGTKDEGPALRMALTCVLRLERTKEGMKMPPVDSLTIEQQQIEIQEYAKSGRDLLLKVHCLHLTMLDEEIHGERKLPQDIEFG